MNAKYSYLKISCIYKFRDIHLKIKIKLDLGIIKMRSTQRK